MLRDLEVPLLITAEGKEIKLRQSDVSSLERLQQLVGGYVEPVYISGDFEKLVMLVDEEGKLKRKPVNKVATQIVRFRTYLREVIAGDVIIISARHWNHL